MDVLRLRPYKKCDAKYIVSWIKDEVSFRKWCADRFDSYPIDADGINNKYSEFDCDDTFFAMTAFDESGVVGHLIMRFLDKERKELRFGNIIVDGDKRGKGYGKEMLKLSAKYAFEILKVKKISLGVFENNEAAQYCYKSAGFKESKKAATVYNFLGEEWKCIELEIENE